MPNVVVIIPMRMASRRYPGKPLIQIRGKTLLKRVYESVSMSTTATRVLVASPDREICLVASSLNIPYVQTTLDCRNGTERVAVAANLLHLNPNDILVNCQGDMFGLLNGDFIDGAVALVRSGAADLATTCADTTLLLGRGDPNTVKAWIGSKKIVRLFYRGELEDLDGRANNRRRHFIRTVHLGVYVSKVRNFMRYYLALAPTIEEKNQSLEQLRWDCEIKANLINETPAKIDVPADFESAEAHAVWHDKYLELIRWYEQEAGYACGAGCSMEEIHKAAYRKLDEGTFQNSTYTG